MSVSLTFAGVTLALRDVLQTALRLDAGWRETGGAPRVTTLPHGKPDKGSGERMNIALVAVEPDRHFRERASDAPASDAPLVFTLRYLITVHVLFPLHNELLIGAALDALLANPVLNQRPAASDDPLETAIAAAAVAAPDDPPRVTVEAAEARSFEILRMPALLVRVAPVVVVPGRAAASLLIDG